MMHFRDAEWNGILIVSSCRETSFILYLTDFTLHQFFSKTQFDAINSKINNKLLSYSFPLLKDEYYLISNQRHCSAFEA